MAAGFAELGVARGDTRLPAAGHASGLRVDDARAEQARRGLGADLDRLQGQLAARPPDRQPRARAGGGRGAGAARRRVRRGPALRARGGARRRARAAAPLGLPGVSLAELERAPGKEPDDRELFLGDTAAILWTSGTTGRSKGVMQSHNVWIRAALDGATNSGLREGEVHLLVPADVPVGRLGREHLPRAGVRRALRDRRALLGARVLGPLPLLRRHHDLHARRHAHLPVAAAAARRRRRQPDPLGGHGADARGADRALQAPLRHRGDPPGLRPERGDDAALAPPGPELRAERARRAGRRHRDPPARRARLRGGARRAGRVLRPPERALRDLQRLLRARRI